MAIGFGAAAERYAARLPTDVDAIAADIDGAVLALESAVERRRSGRTFLAAPLVDDPRALIAQRLGGRWIERLTNIDDRYTAFDALAADRLSDAGVPIEEDDLSVIAEPYRRVLRDFAMMSDALLVRSARDVERISRVLGRRRPFVVAAPGRDPLVHPVRAAHGPKIVVWAPYLDARCLGVIAMALEYLKRDVVYVCASGSLDNVRGRFVRPAEAAGALEQAVCVIDASLSDPASAIALAEIGVPVVAAGTAGASEFLDGVLEYEPWDWRTVFAAVTAAPGVSPPVLKRDSLPLADLRATLERAAPPSVPDPPLVSIVLATYNRPELLAQALDSIERQTYPNIEAVVVNNGGQDVASVTARFKFARLIELPENILPSRALAMAMETMSGEYYGIFSDDDLFYPDHVARLVNALTTADAAAAHTNAATAYISVSEQGRNDVAYRVRHDRPSDILQLLVGATMVIHGMLFKRAVFLKLGGLDSIGASDLEYQMRVAKHYEVIHVDSVTCQWNYRVDGTSYTHHDDMLEGLRAIYELYPSQGSVITERRRRAELQRFEERTGRPIWPPDVLLPQRTS